LLLVAGPFVLSLVVPEPLLAMGIDVLPVALTAFWVATVAALYQSYCEGLQRYLLTNAVLLGGTVLYAILCFVFVPVFGLPAVAMAALLQALASLGAFVVACKLLPDRIPLLPGRWSGRVFRQLLPYGVRLQGMSIASMLYDPVTKFLVGYFGGIGHAAYYDMASRLVAMSRQLLVGANTTLLPAIAGMHASDPGRVEEAHQRDYRVMFAAATVMLLGPAALARQIAITWLGSPVPEFILAVMLLSAAWFINTLSSPSYLFFLGKGELRWPMVSHLVVAFLSPILGLLLGIAAGYGGVLTGSAIAIAAGSIVTMVAYERGRGRSAAALLEYSTVKVFAMSFITVVVCHAAFLIGEDTLDHPTLLVSGIMLYSFLTWLSLRRSPGMIELRHIASVLSAPDPAPGRHTE
jgi:O-antigen/teichoic acid export membrane protein